MKTKIFISARKVMLVVIAAFGFHFSYAQSNVFDDIISQSPDHTYLTAAINQQNLAGALQDDAATLTVFAPTNAAFDQLAADLNTDIAGILALPNLTDVLLYHVLGTTAPSSAITNGLLVTPLNTSNTIKLSLTVNGVFANQAQVTAPDLTADNGVVHVLDAVLLPNETVVDIAIDNGFSTLVTAVVQEGLVPALSNPFGTFTVFAPNNDAFDALAAELGVAVGDLLALPDLSDILLYHVLGAEVPSSAVTNGLLAQPLNTENTIKMTATSGGDVFANHAQVILADVSASNGVVHVIDNVILPSITLVDLALAEPDFDILTAAIIEKELLPVVTDPFATLTVLAPNDAAFQALMTALSINQEQLLALDNLEDILLYHVFDSEIFAGDLENGLLASPINDDNTLKVTVNNSGIFFNQAQVIGGDIEASNGVVHVLDAVLLPVETVVDVAIDNDFTYLTAALIQEGLLPVLTDPLTQYTVFAPTDVAFEALATQLNTDIAGLLALPNLTDILLYHVAAGENNAASLTNGPLAMASGENAIINIDGGVTINQANVTTPDVAAQNGIVHVIDAVILSTYLSVENFDQVSVTAFPNPTSSNVTLVGVDNAQLSIVDLNGAEVMNVSYNGTAVDVSNLTNGMYFIYVSNEQNQHVVRLSIQ
jgi:transforming growth factor-beta-induced protein